MTSEPECEVATLGGGCFWCLEAVFKDLKGVESVVSGYAGGRVENPTYEQVCGGRTGHAEVVQITFDPAIVTFRDLLDVFESGLRLVKAPRTLWAFAEAAGTAPERLEELDRARGRFEELAAEVNLALEHRSLGWQPADPDRLEQGLRLSAEGKTIKADEVRARFRQG